MSHVPLDISNATALLASIRLSAHRLLKIIIVCDYELPNSGRQAARHHPDSQHGRPKNQSPFHLRALSNENAGCHLRKPRLHFHWIFRDVSD